MRFNELRLAKPIVRTVAAEGYTTPTPIQRKAIPEALAGTDVLVATPGRRHSSPQARPITSPTLATISGVRAEWATPIGWLQPRTCEPTATWPGRDGWESLRCKYRRTLIG